MFELIKTQCALKIQAFAPHRENHAVLSPIADLHAECSGCDGRCDYSVGNPSTVQTTDGEGWVRRLLTLARHSRPRKISASTELVMTEEQIQA